MLVALFFAATLCWRDPTRSKQLSTVSILGFQFGLYHVVVALSFLPSNQPFFIVILFLFCSQASSTWKETPETNSESNRIIFEQIPQGFNKCYIDCCAIKFTNKQVLYFIFFFRKPVANLIEAFAIFFFLKVMWLVWTKGDLVGLSLLLLREKMWSICQLINISANSFPHRTKH